METVVNEKHIKLINGQSHWLCGRTWSLSERWLEWDRFYNQLAVIDGADEGNLEMKHVSD